MSVSVCGVSVLQVGGCTCECVCKCVCMAAFLGGVGGCPCAPSQPALAAGVATVGPGSGPHPGRAGPPGEPPPGDPTGASPVQGVAARTGPPRASGAGGTCRLQQPLSPSFPRTAMFPHCERGTAWDPQHCQSARPLRGSAVPPQGRGAAGAVPAGGQPGDPHTPALPTSPAPGGNSGVIRWLAAATALATASGPKFPGVAITAMLPWALPSPRGDQASRRHSFPLTHRGEGRGGISPPRSPWHQWRGRNVDFDGEGASPEPHLTAQPCPLLS